MSFINTGMFANLLQHLQLSALLAITTVIIIVIVISLYLKMAY